MNSRSNYITCDQRKKLVDLVMADTELQSGKFSSTFTLKESQRRWEIIANSLNACGGANKNWKTWRKSWQDLKAKTKSKSAMINRHARGTGGGSAHGEILNEEEMQVLASFNPASITGHSGATESHVQFDMDSISNLPDNISDNVIEIEQPQPIQLHVAEQHEVRKNKNTKGSIMAAELMMKQAEEKLALEKRKIELQEEKVLLKKNQNILLQKILEQNMENGKLMKELIEVLKDRF